MDLFSIPVDGVSDLFIAQSKEKMRLKRYSSRLLYILKFMKEIKRQKEYAKLESTKRSNRESFFTDSNMEMDAKLIKLLNNNKNRDE